ncbi:hypothetical protein TI39_contig70g00003 [Zymoseptoria brevis]|uniref:Uncharacterized protein n=1 Tax=Zymoseptoria brevis TaxID=1047168 RepID=A0A0F4GYC9_9PEZI|nr:hypothetical protein TI39_contig70g00003 [Zymoseptoria brevis]
MARTKQAARKLGGAKPDPLAKFANETEERKAFFANRQAARERTKQDKINRKAKKAKKAANFAANGGGKQANGNLNKSTLPGQHPNQNAEWTKKQKKALNKAAQEQEQQSNTVGLPGLTKKQRKAQARQQEAARERNLLEEQEQLKQDPMYEPSDTGAQQDHQMKGSGEGDDEYEPPETEEVTQRVTRSQVSTLPRRPAKLRAQDIHTTAGQQEKQEAQVQIQRPVWQSHTDTPTQVSDPTPASADMAGRQGQLAICEAWKQCWKSSTLLVHAGTTTVDTRAIKIEAETDRANDQLQRELNQAAAITSNASSSNQMQTLQVSDAEQSLRRLNSWQLRSASHASTERGQAIHAVQIGDDIIFKTTMQIQQEADQTHRQSQMPLPPGSWDKSKQRSEEEISAEAEQKKLRQAEKKARRTTGIQKQQKRQEKRKELEAAQEAQLAAERAGAASGQVDGPPPAKLPRRQRRLLAEEEKRLQQRANDQQHRKPVQQAEAAVRTEMKRDRQVEESVRYQELAEKGVVMANFELMKGRTTFPLDFWEDLAGTRMAAMSRGVGVYM